MTKIYQLLLPTESHAVSDKQKRDIDMSFPNSNPIIVKNTTAMSKFNKVFSTLFLGIRLIYSLPFFLMLSLTPYPE